MMKHLRSGTALAAVAAMMASCGDPAWATPAPTAQGVPPVYSTGGVNPQQQQAIGVSIVGRENGTGAACLVGSDTTCQVPGFGGGGGGGTGGIGVTLMTANTPAAPQTLALGGPYFEDVSGTFSGATLTITSVSAAGVTTTQNFTSPPSATCVNTGFGTVVSASLAGGSPSGVNVRLEGAGPCGGGGGGAVTIASGGVASGAYAAGSIAAGAFVSGSILSGACATGCIADLATDFGTASLVKSNATDAQATSANNLGVASYLYGWNGTGFDRLQVDASKNLKVLDAAPGIAVSTGTPCATVTTTNCSIAAEIQLLINQTGAGVGTAGAAVLTGANTLQIGGSDGTSLRVLATNTSGDAVIVPLGAASYVHLVSTASNNAALAASGAHTILHAVVENPSTTAIGCLHVYNATTNPPVPGTTTITHTYPIAEASAAGQFGGFIDGEGPVGVALSTGFGYSITGGAAGVCTDADTSSAPSGIAFEADYQ